MEHTLKTRSLTLHKNNALSLDGGELDLYAEWAVNEHLSAGGPV